MKILKFQTLFMISTLRDVTISDNNNIYLLKTDKTKILKFQTFQTYLLDLRELHKNLHEVSFTNSQS